jgi:hypothetical protein
MNSSSQLGLEESITDLGCSSNVTSQEIQQEVARVSLARRRKYEEHELRCLTWQHRPRRGCPPSPYISYWPLV